jgi:16S rRNA C967 or C1407 C5-methylase (RsmB/RsmF family)/NOL1/NOP2/fmu family ribosome biogenesis protein
MDRPALLRLVAARSGVLDAAGQQAFVDAHDAPPQVSIRLNRAKWIGGVDGHPVPWASDAYYLTERPTFTFDPLFHAGAYYVQEAGSMFLEAAVRACGMAGADCVALDLCAAPGGKSTHLLSVLGDDAVVVSNEVVRPRARILCDNITKWGRANACVTGSDPALFSGLPGFFDLVLVDAPCSGEGLFRKDAEAMQHWSEEAVAHCAQRQMDILAHAWATLRPGGHLIYSTCTFNRQENEDNVARLMEWGGECVPVPVASAHRVTEVREGGLTAYRFMPHITRAEGFFIAVLRKPGSGEAFRPSVRGGFLQSLQEKESEPWMAVPEGISPVRSGDAVVAVTEQLRSVLPALSKAVYPLKVGVEMARSAKGQTVPSHALAVSCIMDGNAFPFIDLELDAAIHYLRGNPLRAESARGFAVVRYRGLALGLVKGAGNRWNNLYPAPLRIRDMRTEVSAVVTAPL